MTHNVRTFASQLLNESGHRGSGAANPPVTNRSTRCCAMWTTWATKTPAQALPGAKKASSKPLSSPPPKRDAKSWPTNAVRGRPARRRPAWRHAAAPAHPHADQLRRGEFDLLVATDVAAVASTWPASAMCSTSTCRALPRDVHRIGRTSRAGATGTAIALVGRDDVMPLRRASGASPATRFACTKWKAWKAASVRKTTNRVPAWSSAWRQSARMAAAAGAAKSFGDRDHQPREHRGDRSFNDRGGDRQFGDRGGMGITPAAEGAAGEHVANRGHFGDRQPRHEGRDNRRPSVRAARPPAVCRPSGSRAASARRRPASPQAARPFAVRRASAVRQLNTTRSRTPAVVMAAALPAATAVKARQVRARPWRQEPRPRRQPGASSARRRLCRWRQPPRPYRAFATDRR